ncbi:MAG: hypothetical protein OHK0053_24380 [Microscillaceae bacterium]
MYAVQQDITAKINAELEKFKQVKNQDLPAFNEMVYQQKIPALLLESAAE